MHFFSYLSISDAFHRDLTETTIPGAECLPGSVTALFRKKWRGPLLCRCELSASLLPKSNWSLAFDSVVTSLSVVLMTRGARNRQEQERKKGCRSNGTFHSTVPRSVLTVWRASSLYIQFLVDVFAAFGISRMASFNALR